MFKKIGFFDQWLGTCAILTSGLDFGGTFSFFFW